MSITIDQISDAIITTRQNRDKLRYTQLSQKEQDYCGFTDILKNGKIKVVNTGRGVKRELSLGGDRNAKNTTLYDTDSYTSSSSFQAIEEAWVHKSANYSFDEREEEMNSGSDEQVQDYIQEKRIQSMFDLAEHFENDIWTLPGTTGIPGLAGIPYWITANATAGFNGGNNTNYAAGPGGLSATTYSQWRNYTDQYAAVTKVDLIDKMRKAFDRIKFIPPQGVASDPRSYGMDLAIYTKLDTKHSMERLAEQQNDSLGFNLDPAHNITMFRGVPIKWVPKWESGEDFSLSNSAVNGCPWIDQNPVLMLNWDTFRMFFLRNRVLREGSPEKASNQHNVVKVDIDATCQLMCLNRRGNALITTA